MTLCVTPTTLPCLVTVGKGWQWNCSKNIVPVGGFQFLPVTFFLPRSFSLLSDKLKSINVALKWLNMLFYTYILYYNILLLILWFSVTFQFFKIIKISVKDYVSSIIDRSNSNNLSIRVTGYQRIRIFEYSEWSNFGLYRIRIWTWSVYSHFIMKFFFHWPLQLFIFQTINLKLY